MSKESLLQTAGQSIASTDLVAALLMHSPCRVRKQRSLRGEELAGPRLVYHQDNGK